MIFVFYFLKKKLLIHLFLWRIKLLVCSGLDLDYMLGFLETSWIVVTGYIFNYCCILIVWTLMLYFRYGSCATSHDFEIYAQDASFEDPLMRAHGYAFAFHFCSLLFSWNYGAKCNEYCCMMLYIGCDVKQLEGLNLLVIKLGVF